MNFSFKTLLQVFIVGLSFFSPDKIFAQFQLNGAAVSLGSDCYQLTDDLLTQGGSIWYAKKFDLNKSFDIQFTLFLGCKAYSVGADGIAFLFQPLSVNAGASGGGIGYGGITPSLDVEFDTFQNKPWDPAYSHIAIEKGGNADHSIAADLLAGPVQMQVSNALAPDCKSHPGRIIWNSKTKTLKVYYDCSLRLSYTGDIINNAFGGNPNVYWGFTASTGGASNIQGVCITHTFLDNLRDTTICKGTSVPLSVSGGTSYSWSPATGLSSASIANPIATPLTNTKYIVTITDSCGISAKDSITISVPFVTVNNTVSNLKCVGDNSGAASVTVTGGSGATTYNWSTAATSQTVTGLAATTYTVTLSDNGCTTVTTLTLTEPQILAGTSSNTPSACGQNNGTASVNAVGGTGTINYLWSTSASSQTIAGLSPNGYTVTLTDGNGCTTSTSTTFVDIPGPVATAGVLTYLKCNGDNNGTAGVSVVGGTGILTYVWSNGGTSVVGSNLSATSYTVTVTDANNCKDVKTVAFTQPAKVALKATGLNARCNKSCDGQGVVIPSGGTSPYSASWSTLSSALSVNGLCAGTYSVTITDGNGCSKDSSIAITEPVALALTPGSTAADCNQSNGSVSVGVTGGTPASSGYGYSWTGGASAQTVSNLAPGTYSVTVTDQNNCSTTASIAIQNLNGVTASIQSVTSATCFGSCNGAVQAQPVGGAAPYVYIWTNGSASQTASSLCAGNYTVTITDAKNCSSTTVALVNQPAVLSIAAIPTSTTCIGKNNSLTTTPGGGTPTYTIVWNPGAQTGAVINVQLTQTTTFTVSASDANGCTAATQTAVVNVNPPLTATINNIAPVCPGASVNLSGNAIGGDASYTYTWLVQPVKNTPAITIVADSQKTYALVVNDGCGTPADTALVTVLMNPVPKVKLVANPTSGCPTLCVSFIDSSKIASGTITEWLWDFGDSTSTIKNPVACFDAPGKYGISLQVKSDRGCFSSDSIPNMITVFSKPVANFSNTPENATILDPFMQFNDQSTDAVSWLWDFADPYSSKIGAGKNPSHAYSEVGTYCPKLLVTNSNNCIDTITRCIDVTPEFAFYIPNAFTPNTNGLNDGFKGSGVGIKIYKMSIYDRWGLVIFLSDDVNETWDGKSKRNGQLAPQDVYLYKFEITDIFDKPHTYTGHVSLVR